MKNYYSLKYFAGNDDRIIDADVKFTPSTNDYYDQESTKIELFSKIEFQFDKGIKEQDEDFFRTTSGVFFGSDEFCKILKQYQPDIKLVQTLGKFANGDPVEKSYYLIHPGKRIDALDYNLSEYSGKNLILSERASGKLNRMVKGITKLVINQDQALDNNYFFLANAIYLNPIVSEDLLNALIKNKMKISYHSL